jgi:hypothetical protein
VAFGYVVRKPVVERTSSTIDPPVLRGVTVAYRFGYQRQEHARDAIRTLRHQKQVDRDCYVLLSTFDNAVRHGWIV